MRWALALGGALALAGCATPNERVTLLAPVQPEKIESGNRGSLVVEYEGGETAITGENEQAQLRGRTRPPQLTTLDQPDPRHVAIVGNFPPDVGTLEVPFEKVGSMELSPQQTAQVTDGLRSALQGRPAPQIEVVGHTSSDGGASRNMTISLERAAFVANILRGLGFEIDDTDIIGRGEALAVSEIGDEIDDVRYRRVDVIVR